MFLHCALFSTRGSVNGVVLLAAMVLVAEPSAATAHTRQNTLFSIMDFNGLGKINVDELVLFD